MANLKNVNFMSKTRFDGVTPSDDELYFVDYGDIDFVVESYNDGANWYRKYKSGWIEQGGTVIGTGDINVTFLKPFANTNYTIINTYMDNSSTDTINLKNVSVWNRTNTSFYIRTSGTSGVNKAWFACGQGA
jgi:hypothetical protein